MNNIHFHISVFTTVHYEFALHRDRHNLNTMHAYAYGAVDIDSIVKLPEYVIKVIEIYYDFMAVLPCSKHFQGLLQ